MGIRSEYNGVCKEGIKVCQSDGGLAAYDLGLDAKASHGED